MSDRDFTYQRHLTRKERSGLTTGSSPGVITRGSLVDGDGKDLHPRRTTDPSVREGGDNEVHTENVLVFEST